jgi:hypothetical protein
MWTLQYLIDYSRTHTVYLDFHWVPARPVNHKCRKLTTRIKEAWMVFTGKADCFTWPEGQ